MATADNERLGQTVGRRLLGIGEVHAVVGAVAKQATKRRQVFGSGDDQDIPDSGEHEHRDGIIDHRLVVDGQQLFADAFGDGIKPGAAAAGQDNTFHSK